MREESLLYLPQGMKAHHTDFQTIQFQAAPSVNQFQASMDHPKAKSKSCVIYYIKLFRVLTESPVDGNFHHDLRS